MSKYLLNNNKQDSKRGDNYELHNEETCNRLPNHSNRLYIGNFSNCQDAMREAKAKYPYMASDIDGCFYCCSACHKE
jgi:hypothetical protein